MQGSNSGSRLRAFRSWFLVFWAVLIGLLFSRVPPLSAEWRPSADSARVVAHYPFRALLSAAAAPPGSETARSQEEAAEAASSASGDLTVPSAARLVRTAVRHPITQGMRAPLVQVTGAPTILVKARDYPAVRSRESSPSRED